MTTYKAYRVQAFAGLSLNAGALVALFAHQAATRAAALKPAIEGGFRVTAPIQFKVGEVIGLPDDISRALAAKLEPVDLATLVAEERAKLGDFVAVAAVEPGNPAAGGNDSPANASLAADLAGARANVVALTAERDEALGKVASVTGELDAALATLAEISEVRDYLLGLLTEEQAASLNAWSAEKAEAKKAAAAAAGADPSLSQAPKRGTKGGK